MEKLFTVLKNLDRRIIYLIVFLSILLPLLPGFGFLRSNFSVNKETQMVYDYIEEQTPGSAIFFDFAFDPTTQAELLPMAEATIKHSLRKGHKVFMYYSSITAIVLGQNLMVKLKNEEEFAHIQEGVNYINLGYLPITVDMMLFSMQTDFKNTFKKEGVIFEGVKTLKDIKFIVCFSGSSAGEIYVADQRRFGYKTTSGVTAVMGPAFVPFVQTGQATGYLNGLRGAAEYEKLVGYRGSATAGMASLTLSHLVILGFIVLGNIIYIYERKQRRKRG